MACTTILVGSKASYDGSTMIARNDDGHFDVKKCIVVEPKDQPRKYRSVIGKLTIELPDNPLRYTMMKNVDPKAGVWPASGVNSEGVGMTATETITSNPRVKGADPYVLPEEKRNGKPGGIGEEDLVLIVLPYIHSAREGVLRLGELLEKYGTYEPNGIAFNDTKEVWWLETIGGHHWIAKRVPDDRYVVMPNQFGLDNFDWDDAYGEQKENLCSKDLKEFVKKNHLDLGNSGKGFNPRLAFGSHADSDHVYNTPRAWFMLRYFNPRTYKWDGEDADFTPESDDLPWSMVPENKITIEDVKYILSSYYQGTPYNPFGKDEKKRGIYRPIGISRTSFMSCLQARPYVPKEISTIEWFCMGCNAFNSFVAIYPSVPKIPDYFSKTELTVDSTKFYWANRLIGVIADSHFAATSIHIERYQNRLQERCHELIIRTDKKFSESKDLKVLEEADREMADIARKETDECLKNVLAAGSEKMKTGYSRTDN